MARMVVARGCFARPHLRVCVVLARASRYCAVPRQRACVRARMGSYLRMDISRCSRTRGAFMSTRPNLGSDHLVMALYSYGPI